MADRYLCPECNYTYDESIGDEREGYEPGTTWDDIDPDVFCPDCGLVPKHDFVKAA